MELDFTEKDFGRLMFRVDTMPDNADLFKSFPRLQKWDEFKLKFPAVKRNKIFKWIVYTYDIESPFRIKINDVMQRKVEVARYVRLIDENKEVPDDIKKLLTNQDKNINAAIVAYCRMHRQHKYSLIVALEEMYYADILSARNKPDGFRGNLSNRQEELEKAALGFLNNDNNPNINDTLFQYIEDDRVDNFRPEGIAELLETGKDPFEGKKYDSAD